MPGESDLKGKSDLTISEEARRLLTLMAQRSGVSQSHVLELAVREKAAREPVDGANGGTPSVPDAAARRVAARQRFCELMVKARAGFEDLTEEEIEHEVQLAVSEARSKQRASHP